ncbi:unnamed protein product [Paramecium pentaurelia]|uniref:Uncharacterized protein n=1 Tax=Paramecium pentaurelia TaxID=43138 RepID=A0A8S1Y0T2_9CILI|nr:unnamed protein product [Paramecium pentaurelia]
MDFVNEKYAVIPKSLKSDEEIQKNMAPESNSFVERAKYLLINGQSFQKTFVAKNIRESLSDPKGALQLLEIIANQLHSLHDESLIKEYIKAVSEIFNKIQIPNQIKQSYSDICFNIFTKQYQQYEIINSCAEILKYLDDLDIYKEGLYLETDNQMYQILKIIEIYYHKFTPELKKQAHLQIKSSMKHKDERVRKIISEILLNNQQLLKSILHEFDWIDKFTTLIYDQSKDVRMSSAKFFLATYELNEDIHKSRLQLLLENIIKQLDSSQFEFCQSIAQYSLNQDNLQSLYIEKINEIINNNNDNQFRFLESLHNYYSLIKQFNEKHSISIDDMLLNSIQILSEEMRNYDILKCLSNLYSNLSQDMQFKVIQKLFINFELNQLIFIPYLSEIIEKTTLINKNKIWLQQLQTIYEMFKRNVFQYETKGLWNEISNMIDIMIIISRILFLQKDFLQQCLKMSHMGSNFIRDKIMNILIEKIIELDSLESRDSIIQNYLAFINHSNYQLRQLSIEFIMRLCQQRSRKFFISNNLINVLQLQYDAVSLVRAKLPKLLFQIKLLFWNDEKEILSRIAQIFQNLMNDKKLSIQQISKEFWVELSNIQFLNAQKTIEQNQVMDEREQQEYANLKVIKQQLLLNPKNIKNDVSKSRNQTPTTRLPPLNKRQNNFLQIPKGTQPRKTSAQRAILSKSPQPFK